MSPLNAVAVAFVASCIIINPARGLTEGGLNDTSVPANVPAESPAATADECKDASDAEIRAQLPVESEDNICEALGSIHACDHPVQGEAVRKACPRTCNMCGCGSASTLASASNDDDDQAASWTTERFAAWYAAYKAQLAASKTPVTRKRVVRKNCPAGQHRVGGNGATGNPGVCKKRMSKAPTKKQGWAGAGHK